MKKIKIFDEFKKETGEIRYSLEEGEFNEYNEAIYFFLYKFYTEGHGFAYFIYKGKEYLIESAGGVSLIMPQGPVSIVIRLEGELYQKYLKKAKELGDIYKEEDFEISDFRTYLNNFKEKGIL